MNQFHQKLLPLFLMSFLLNPALAKKSQSILSEADQVYQNRLDINQAQKALHLYQVYLSSHPESVEGLWKASRASWWIGDQIKKKKIKKELFRQGIDYAKKSVELSDSCAECHFWLGGNYGSYGEVKGILKSLAMIKPIRKEMAKVNELKPDLEDGGGYRILGIVNYKVPGFAGGNKKKAGEQLEKAFSFNPKNPINLYYLAEYYKVVRKRDKARALLTELEAMKEGDGDWADIVNMQRKATILRKKLK